ncbi:methyl-accepting chemotaxis protein [Shewanella sp. SR43-4]|jgi:methyl-accepting chemotaxis protein|uniref:methyl-accepting chemotaxis protein n=1 Tax=Shewanella TaxID=22 RepID=UPI000C468A06|nr:MULTISPECIES: methyl-accepting chemotaxis protein [Shewanella]NCQ44709.1 methyl-accepting chemotaxis protein [Shewanella frigidimarina]MBB1319742.1 methyl-accepting chemotaxis protein [Shewanella sp. SR43-4]MBB1321249.1 methyl-accepting chemotaxis protein [Shewanella sp. SR43-8]MBB1390691.1 methyl-accepting chemotaxis protein [Shewanella sp. SG44-6]MBB1474170.1 methyl-accepting chemotaxis protein [Shewanella sp. SG41-3]
MKELSIRSKLLWITSTLFIVTVISLSLSLWLGLKEKNAELATQVEIALKQEINDKLSARAGEYGERVAGFINEAYRIPFSFAGLLEQSSKKDPLSRERVELSVAAILQKNSQLSSMYAQFEPNGYDGLDSEYTQGAPHSVVSSGTMEIYYTRNDDGTVEQNQVDDAAEKYITTLNEFGMREAEWYLCAKDTKKPCLMEPYLYEITPGNTALMTSLTVPVIVDNQFKGLVGADINLPIFQTMIMELSKSLYGGEAKVTLVSQKGFVVAASHYKKLARPLSESVGPELAKKLLALNNSSGFVNEPNTIAVAYPINIPIANATWSLIIEAPKSNAFMAVDDMNTAMNEMATSLGSLLLTIGIIVTAIAVLIISLVIKSIISPLNMIQARVENLASAEGDLTQSIEVESHAELIALGSGINAFIAKLRYLISELKVLADRSQQESIKSADIAKHTRESVNRQYGEIESVVTAVNQMSATALEVAKASEQTAMETESMTVNVKDGQTRLTQAMVFVEGMSTDSEQAQKAVGMVSQSSSNISRILEVISSIAEQTNLLALNAAIEAARAGEQGRGFAVVADEVRTLASRTQKSTNEISTLIESLQKEVKNASSIIDKGAQGAQKAVEQTQLALQSLNAIVEQINEVSGQVTHIATAAEEQSAVTEEVNRNITGISDSASELSQLADSAQQSSDSLAKLVDEQHQQLAKLRT